MLSENRYHLMNMSSSWRSTFRHLLMPATSALALCLLISGANSTVIRYERHARHRPKEELPLTGVEERILQKMKENDLFTATRKKWLAGDPAPEKMHHNEPNVDEVSNNRWLKDFPQTSEFHPVSRSNELTPARETQTVDMNPRYLQDATDTLEKAGTFHNKSLSNIVQEILSLKSHGQLLTTLVDDIADVTAGRCIEVPRLTLKSLSPIGSLLFSISNYEPAPVSCAGVEVVYKVLGGACVHDPAVLFSRLYDQGLAGMALGADREEAFAPFQHARALAWTLRNCEPALNPSTKIALPHSYAVLYDLFAIRLLARLRHTGRLTDTESTEAQIASLSACSAIQKQKVAATTLALELSLLADEHLPSPAAVSTAIRISAGTATKKIVQIAEEECNRGEDDNSRYFLQRLRGKPPLTNSMQECCASECAALVAMTRMVGGLQTCCRGCNRFRCDASDSTETKALARASTVTRPGTSVSSPEIVSLVV